MFSTVFFLGIASYWRNMYKIREKILMNRLHPGTRMEKVAVNLTLSPQWQSQSSERNEQTLMMIPQYYCVDMIPSRQ